MTDRRAGESEGEVCGGIFAFFALRALGADRALQSSLSARRLAGVGRAEIPIAVVTNVRGDAVRAGSTVSSFWRRDIIRRAVRQQHGVHVAAKFVLALVGDGFYASAVLASAPAARLRRLVDCGYEAGFIFGGEAGEVADLGLQLRPNRQRRLCAGVRVWIRTTLDDAELCIYGWSRSTAVGRATIHAYAQGTAVLCQHLMRYDAAVADIGKRNAPAAALENRIFYQQTPVLRKNKINDFADRPARQRLPLDYICTVAAYVDFYHDITPYIFTRPWYALAFFCPTYGVAFTTAPLIIIRAVVLSLVPLCVVFEPEPVPSVWDVAYDVM